MRVQSELVATLEGHADSVLSLALTPDNTTLFTGSGDNTIKVCLLALDRGRCAVRSRERGTA